MSTKLIGRIQKNPYKQDSLNTSNNSNSNYIIQALGKYYNFNANDINFLLTPGIMVEFEVSSNHSNDNLNNNPNNIKNNSNTNNDNSIEFAINVKKQNLQNFRLTNNTDNTDLKDNSNNNSSLSSNEQNISFENSPYLFCLYCELQKDNLRYAYCENGKVYKICQDCYDLKNNEFKKNHYIKLTINILSFILLVILALYVVYISIFH